MINKSMIASVFLASALLVSGPGSAQTAEFDVASVRSGCAASAAQCQAAVAAAIAALQALGLTPEQLNSQLGALASAALDAAAALPPAEMVALAATISAIADASTNPGQIAALTTIEQNLAAGEAVDLAAFAAEYSPG